MNKHFVIFDTEYTTWDGAQARHWSGEKEYREIVQIGALKIDQETLEEVDRFDVFIKPTINPELSPFFTELTGITQDELDEKGVSFEEGFTQFNAFCDSLLACSYGNDSMIIAENIALLKRFDIFSNKIYYMNFAKLYHDADPETRKHNSGHLATYLGIDLGPGQEHNAYYDCRSLLAALRYYVEQGKITLSF